MRRRKGLREWLRLLVQDDTAQWIMACAVLTGIGLMTMIHA